MKNKKPTEKPTRASAPVANISTNTDKPIDMVLKVDRGSYIEESRIAGDGSPYLACLFKPVRNTSAKKIAMEYIEPFSGSQGKIEVPNEDYIKGIIILFGK